MPVRNIEWLIEEYGIQLCRTHSALKHIAMRHKDDRQKPVPTCITFSAEKGNDRLDLISATEVRLRVSYRSDTGSPQQNSLVADAIDECFSGRYTASLDVPDVLENFTAFWIEDDQKTSEREDTKSLRRFSYEIPITAKLRT